MKHQLLWMMVVVLTAGMVACSGDEVFEASPVGSATKVVPFQWTRSEDVETHQEFLRNLGVGYSYDAVRGSYCDWQDIRCQVLNRGVIQKMQNETGEPLLTTDLTRNMMLDSHFDYSFRDYVVNMEMNTREKIDLGLYNKEKRHRQFFIEDGVQEMYFYQLSQKVTLAHQYVSWANLSANFFYDEDILTKSFRNAIDHLSKTSAEDFASVDSFINVWGTHVVVESWLGAAIHVDLMNNMWRWTALSKDEAWTTEEFLDAVATKDERRKTSAEYRWTEHSRLNITARGGDQESLTGLLGDRRYDGTREFNLGGISTWRRSLRYDPKDERNSNVEMVDMKLLPIWEFAAFISEPVAIRIKTAVMQDAALLQQMLGDKNFFDARFPIRYTKALCRWRKNTGTWQQASRSDSDAEPMIVNIMSGGRYVATVCHETINDRDLWVCYPIYEGRVKLACGLGVDKDNHAYKVKWIGGKATLTEVEEITAGEYFYINEGGVEMEPREGVAYPDYQALPYIELSGGVKPDGSYAGTAYSVKKEGEDFLILAPAGLTDIVGFTDTGKDSGGKRIYKRNDNYVYIYNQNEIK